MKTKAAKKETKNVKILLSTHKKLKMYVAKHGYNIVDYVSSLIEKDVKNK